MMRCLLLLACLAVAYGQNQRLSGGQVSEEASLQLQEDQPPAFICPESYGDFADPEFCDYFWRCQKGEATEMSCEDGHSFDESLAGSVYPCNYNFKVPCDAEKFLQEPKAGKNGTANSVCERENGIYPDPELCDVYFVCKGGVATKTYCAANLHFELTTRECVWPEEANRGACPDREVLPDGFQCPLDAEGQLDINGNKIANPVYLNENDCRLFYVCLFGKRPTQGGCPEGTVFNDVSQKCDDPANVVGCENYYEPAPETLA